MSFSQAVYSNLDEANTQLQAYFSNKITTRAWDPDVVVGLNQWVQDTNDLNEHWYGDDGAILDRYCKRLSTNN